MLSEKIRILLIKRKVKISELAGLISIKPQNLRNKLSRDNFNEKEMQAIANALGCKLNIGFILDDTRRKYNG